MKPNEIIISETPFRLPLGGGSSDLPAYYEKYGGFIFGVAVKMYMRILIGRPFTDDDIHLQYRKYECESSPDSLKHEICREALRMMGIDKKIFISFHADTPAGTGLGSSGACAVGLIRGLATYTGCEIGNLEVAKRAFTLTQNIKLTDGKQDPYICALGGFTVLDIARDGKVSVSYPDIKQETIDSFFNKTLFFYTGIQRESQEILRQQGDEKVLDLKHQIKDIGKKILACFCDDDLDSFGELLDKHWEIKRQMPRTSSEWIEAVYLDAKKAGSLGGKIIGAGGGGYFMFYCPTEKTKTSVRKKMADAYPLLREIEISADEYGTRARVLTL